MGKRYTNPEKTTAAQKVIRRIGLWCFVFLLLFTAAYGANNRIEVSEYVCQSGDLSYSFDGFRIVHLSDLHSKTFIQDNAGIMRKIREQNPDIIVMTGDMIDCSNHTDIPASEKFIRQASEIAPVYYVFGNHENLIDKSEIEPFKAAVRECGAILLENERVQISSRTGQTISLIGMDDSSLQANLLGKLAEESGDDFQILLAHEPQYFEENYVSAGVDLVLCGHAHGGQFRIPFTHKGIWAPDQGFFPEKTEGCLRDSATGAEMIISRGLGNSAFPFRAFNHPEIVCVTLRVSG
ncbi:MAG: metallophosphoesterase [Oscillospiraceae bacterium]|nr:metallophosphoesterase [Oscillospiraceae bacterium]